MPRTQVEFEFAGDHARLRKAQPAAGQRTRGSMALEALSGTADIRMSTGQILALTRGEGRFRRKSRG
jgi:hypothetical protein